MSKDNKDLYMVVNIERTKKRNKQYPNHAWVSFANLQGGSFRKYWIDLSSKQINYGMIGTLDENREFYGTQEYFGSGQRYSVGQVISVEQGEYYSCKYKYCVGLADGDFDASNVESSALLATVGNRLLLYYDKYVMNLTTMENCWNLLNHYSVEKYGLRPSYCGLSAKKHGLTSTDKEYKNSDGKIVRPVVIDKYYGGNRFRVFEPNNYWRDISICSSGIWRPWPRPSDIVLVGQTEKNMFVLVDNLTMAAQLRNMQSEFGLPQHQAEIEARFKEFSR